MDGANTNALRGLRLFADVSPEAMTRVVDASTWRTLARGDALYSPGELRAGIYFVFSGFIRRTRQGLTAKHITLDLIGPGGFCGEDALTLDGPREDAAEATRASRIMEVPRAVLTRLLVAQPLFGLAFTGALIESRNRFEAELGNRNGQNVLERVALHLLTLADVHGIDRDSRELSTRPTHQEIADHLGIARESTSAALSRLRKLGVISNHDGRLALPNLEILRNFVQAFTAKVNR